MSAPAAGTAPPPLLSERSVTRVDLAQIAAWTLLALCFLPRGGHFLGDEAELYARALHVAETLRPAAFGWHPSGSSLPMLGGGAIDLLAVPFLFTRNPLAGTVWVVLLSALGALLFERALLRLAAPPELRLAATTFFVWSIWHARFADRIWNPHLLLFASPLLFYGTAVLRGGGRAPALRDGGGRASALRDAGVAFGWGLAAALCVQCHGSGVVPVALCALMLLPLEGDRGLSPHFLWAAPLGLAVGYAPYLAADAPTGFAVLRAWTAAAPSRVDATAGRLALESFAIFPSHAAVSFPAHPGHGLWSVASAATFWIALVLAPLGFLVPGRWRFPCAAAVLLVPLSIWASRRGFTHSYVVASIPFLILPAAAGLALVARRFRGLAAGYLAAFALLGAGLLVREYGRPGLEVPPPGGIAAAPGAAAPSPILPW